MLEKRCLYGDERCICLNCGNYGISALCQGACHKCREKDGDTHYVFACSDYKKEKGNDPTD